MPSDAFIGVLTGLGSAHRERQKNIFDQEVERRSKYEQFLQKAATDPAYRPEAQDQFAQLYTTILQTPPEKKLPKDFERQITDALTSVQGSVNTSQGGSPQAGGAPGPVPGATFQPELQEPAPFQGKVPARFSADEKFAEAMRLLNAELEARGRSAVDLERQKLAMQPAKFGTAGPESLVYDERTGAIVHKPELKPVKPPDLSFQEASYEDFKKRPDLTKKYGSDRMGYQAWRDAVELDRQRAGAQNRFDIQDPARNFSQERQLAAQLLSETDMDRQRLQSYQNLQSVGTDLTGANQIVVLYNFIRLMDPNRVSEGELAIAQRAQTVPEEWKAIIGRVIGSPNIFSPEGAARLKAAADAMGKGIQKRVSGIADRYKEIARSGGLNPENVVRGIPELLGPTQQQAPPVGFERDGWIFQGGDPSSPSSWRKK